MTDLSSRHNDGGYRNSSKLNQFTDSGNTFPRFANCVESVVAVEE